MNEETEKKLTIERLSEFCECSIESAEKFVELMTPCYIAQGALIYAISDRLSEQGY